MKVKSSLLTIKSHKSLSPIRLFCALVSIISINGTCNYRVLLIRSTNLHTQSHLYFLYLFLKHLFIEDVQLVLFVSMFCPCSCLCFVSVPPFGLWVRVARRAGAANSAGQTNGCPSLAAFYRSLRATYALAVGLRTASARYACRARCRS